MRDALGRLRRFNRLLTRRIGLVADRYLGSPLSFAQARLLYEVGLLAPLATHHLRRLLVVDPAALSRGLAALEARQLIRRHVDPGNRRNRIVEVTARGRRLLRTLDRRADARVAAVIAGLAARDPRGPVGAGGQAAPLPP